MKWSANDFSNYCNNPITTIASARSTNDRETHHSARNNTRHYELKRDRLTSNSHRSPTSSPNATYKVLVFFASLLLCVSHSQPPLGTLVYLPIHETDCLSNARPRASKTLTIASPHVCYYNSLIEHIVLTKTIRLKHGFRKHARLGFSVAIKTQIATALGITRREVSARINLIQAIWQHHLSSQSN